MRYLTPIDDKLPQGIDVDLDVMVSSSDFSVTANVSNFDDARPLRIATGLFYLPGDGSPAETPEGVKYLTFRLKSPKGRGTVHARIGYYYRYILVQSQQLTAHVGEPGGFAIDTDFTVSADLTGLDKVPARPRISVLTNANADGSHHIVLRHPGKPRDGSDPAATLAVKATPSVPQSTPCARCLRFAPQRRPPAAPPTSRRTCASSRR